MKLGVISDGIDRDPAIAARVAADHGLEYIDFQFVWDQEIGDQDAEQVKQLSRIVKDHGLKVGCLTRHNFAGLPCKLETIRSEAYSSHFEKYKRCFELANELECDSVRLMSGRKDMILFGANGAEQWVTATGAWEAQVEMFREPVAYAERMGTTVVTENCNGGQITSNILAMKMLEAIGSENLKILWDPCNAMYCTEKPYPEGYERARSQIRHVHIKDAKLDVAGARVEFRSLGQGDMGPYLYDIGAAMRRDGFDGIVSLESNYMPTGKTFADGFESSISHFKAMFG